MSYRLASTKGILCTPLPLVRLMSKVRNLTLEGDGKPLLCVETDVFFALHFSLSICLVFFCLLVGNFPKQVQKARRIFNQGWEQLGCANQMRGVLYQNKSAHCHLDLRQQRVYSVLRCPLSAS